MEANQPLEPISEATENKLEELSTEDLDHICGGIVTHGYVYDPKKISPGSPYWWGTIIRPPSHSPYGYR